MVEVVANSLNTPTSTLTSGVTSGSSSLPVAAPTAPDLWPTTGTFRVEIGLELIAVTAASGSATSLAVVSRGVEGTSAAAHSSGAAVAMVDTAASQAARFLPASESIDQIAAANPTGADWSNNSNKITTTKDPTNPQDVATKNYVDTAINGLDWKASVVLATQMALPANVYNNGASGVGATLTGLSTGVLTIDGTAVVVGQRVLVKNEAAPANNGIYVVTTIGTSPALYVLTRAADYNQASEIQAGDAVYVTAGSANVDTSWVMTTTTTPFVVGSTSMVWSQFGGNLVTSVFGRTGAVVAATNDYSEAQISFTDITTNNVSTSKHGFAPKAPNDATKYLDGTGAYSDPLKLVVTWPPPLYYNAAVGSWTSASSRGPSTPFDTNPFINRVFNSAQNDALTWNFPFTLPAGTYTLYLSTEKSTNFGIQTWETSADGSSWTALTTFDSYAAADAYTQAKITGLSVAASFSWIRVRMATKNASSSSYITVLSGMTLIKTA